MASSASENTATPQRGHTHTFPLLFPLISAHHFFFSPPSSMFPALPGVRCSFSGHGVFVIATSWHGVYWGTLLPFSRSNSNALEQSGSIAVHSFPAATRVRKMCLPLHPSQLMYTLVEHPATAPLPHKTFNPDWCGAFLEESQTQRRIGFLLSTFLCVDNVIRYAQDDNGQQNWRAIPPLNRLWRCFVAPKL